MAQSTISQRIALEGAEDILKQLADLGQAGEKAVKQIQDASAGTSSPGLANLSNIAENVRAAFGRVGEAVAPVRAAFSELGAAAHEVGTRLTEVASIFGVGLVAGVAGGLAGIFELIKASAESAHQLEVQAEVLGISILDLKTFGASAAAAGVDSDRLNTALTRFQQNVGKQNEQLFQDSIKLLQMLPAAASQAGVAVVQGIKPAGDAIKSHIISNITDSLPLINTAIDQIRTQLSEHGIALPDSFFQGVRQNLLNVAGDATKSAETIRLALAQFGVNLPAQTVFEQLAGGAQKAKNPLLELGVTLGDLQKLNVTETILKSVDGLEKMGPTTERARLSLALFGRTWPEVLKALRDGSDGFERLREKVTANNPDLDANVGKLSESEKALIGLQLAGKNLRDQLSAIFAPEIIAVANGFSDAIKDNRETLKAWAKVISDEALPGITNLIKQFTGEKLPTMQAGAGGTEPPGTAFDRATADNGRTTLESLGATATRVAAAISTAFNAIKAVLSSIATALNAVFGTNFNAAGVAAVLIVGQLTGAFALLLPLLAVAAASIALLATPVGLVIAAIGLVVVAIINWRSTLDGLLGAVSAAAQGISGSFSAALGFLSSLFGAISGAIQSLAGVVAPAVSGIFSAITQALQGALAAAGQVLGNFFGQTLPELISAAVGLFPNLWGHLGDGLSLAITAIREAFDFLTGFVTTSVGIILGALRDVGDFISGIASKIASLGSRAASAAGGGPDASGVPDASAEGGLGVDSGAALQAGGGMAGFGPFGRGPRGTDTIPAYLSPGEFVVRMQAVQHYGTDFFHALNSMRLPFDLLRGFSLGGLVADIGERFAPMPMMLAGGGPVLAAAGGGALAPVHLHMPGGDSFMLEVKPGQVFDKLVRHARSSAMRSAGSKPSWYTS